MIARRGMTLVEVMVVIAIIVVVTGVAMPSLYLLMDLQQRKAVDQLASAFAYLRDEATIRNITFRIAFNVDRGQWQVQAGSSDYVIFENAEERERWEEETIRQLDRYTEREIQEGEADTLLDATGRFQGITDVNLGAMSELPGGTMFAWVYTPQYHEPVEPQEFIPEDPADDQIVYTYIFPNGQMEFCALRIVSESDMSDGYTLLVEPLTGRIHVLDEDVDFWDLYSWIPDTAPEIPEG